MEKNSPFYILEKAIFKNKYSKLETNGKKTNKITKQNMQFFFPTHIEVISRTYINRFQPYNKFPKKRKNYTTKYHLI